MNPDKLFKEVTVATIQGLMSNPSVINFKDAWDNEELLDRITIIATTVANSAVNRLEEEIDLDIV